MKIELVQGRTPTSPGLYLAKLPGCTTLQLFRVDWWSGELCAREGCEGYVYELSRLSGGAWSEDLTPLLDGVGCHLP